MRERMLNRRHAWLTLTAGLVGLAAGLVFAERTKTITPQAQIRLAGQTVQVELADTPLAQTRGLGGRCQLAINQGMLFRYREPSQPTYWMKRMRFSIDLIWIRNGIVVGYEEALPVDGGQRRYDAPEPVDEVLEVPAGWIRNFNLTRGNRVEFLGLL